MRPAWLLLLLPWGLHADPACHPPPPPLPHHPDGRLHLEADRLEAHDQTRYHLQGHVTVERDAERLQAPQVDYLRPRGLIEAPQGLRYQNPRLELEGRRARWWLDGPRARMEQARYRLWGNHGHGQAQEIRLQDQRLTLDRADYTTCPDDRPPAWRLHARHITLEPEKNQGTARHLTLHLGPVPILWLPYLQFPLGGRKTGLLPPTLDQSAQRGWEYAQPLYLNLAPNYDATLTLRHMSLRGTQAQGEFRYLGRNGQGTLQGDYLPRDRQRGEDRSWLEWRHRHRHGPLSLDLHWQQASDRDYFRDLGTRLSEVNRPYLERRLRLQGRRGPWRLDLLAQDYQRLDPSLTEPYRRAPRLRLSGNGRWWALEAEHSRFQRGDTLIARRNRLHPRLEPRLARPYGYLRPILEVRTIHYADGPTLTVPSLSLDGALYLDRRRASVSETLTPRLFWSYTPYRPQDTLPRLDTSPLPPGSARLFTSARYGGGDRVGDRHSLTLALDYDRRSPHFRQTLSLAALAQLADQRLRLPGETPARVGQIEPVLLWRGRTPGPLRAHAELHAPDLGRDPDRARFGVNYAAGDLAATADYQYAAGNGQLQLRLWQRRGPWQWGAASRLDLSERRELESLAGIGYRSCCWSLALNARRYRIGTDDRPVHRLTLTVELDGLGRSGRDLRQRLGL